MIVDPSVVDPVVTRLRDGLGRVRELVEVQAPLAAPMVDELLRGLENDAAMIVNFWEQAEAEVVNLIDQLPAQSTLDI